MKLRFSIRSLLLAVSAIAVGLAVVRFLHSPAAYIVPTYQTGYPVTARCNSAAGHRCYFKISEAEIKRSPTWDVSRSNPPLPAQDAIIRADKLRLRMIADKKI